MTNWIKGVITLVLVASALLTPVAALADSVGGPRQAVDRVYAYSADYWYVGSGAESGLR